MKTETLDEIAIRFGTDKSSKGHSYAQYYEQVLAPLKFEKLNILEIGVWEGASLKMFKEYFQRASIYGIDIHDKTQYDEYRIKTYICDQTSNEQLNEFVAKTPQMDIIVDDGIHEGIAQWTSFATLFPALKPGGYYIVEDLLCAYDARWNYPLNFLNKVRDMVDQVMMSRAIPNSHICANKQEAVKKYTSDYFSEHIESIFLACGIVFIKKM